MWLFWWADAGQPLNPVLIPLTTGLLLVAGALLTPFRPRLGGAVMLLAAAVTLVVLGTDIGPQMLFLYGVSANVLALVVLLVGPGVLALLSARGPQ